MTRVALAVFAFAAVVVAAPVPKAKPKAALHPHAVGDRWEYIRNGDENKVWSEEVTESAEKDGVVTFRIDMTADGGRIVSSTYTLGDGQVKFTQGSGNTYDPAMLLCTATMKDGDTWTDKYTINGRGYEVAVSAGKAEELTTPAGKFTATPVTRRFVEPKVAGDTVWWFNAEVGLVRQTANGKPVQDLKAFTPAKK